MKQCYTIVCLLIIHLNGAAQLNQGGLHALFGVDADTKADYIKYGPSTGAIASDDWFSSSGAYGTNVIDTSNAAYYKSLLQAGNNISFTKRMSTMLYANVNGKIWLDAVYTRDYVVSTVDSSTFVGGSKNGDDPANWHGVVSSIPTKTDLVDVFGHMRRNGTNVHDSLWFFTGVSTAGTSGSRYYDIELYKNKISYNPTTTTFTTGGPDAGHTQWKFDASGNITQTGDMIIAVSYTSGAPTVEVRIWISQTTYNTVIPSLFNFGSSFDGSTTAFGYASIVSKAGTTAFGSGIANLSATPAADTTYSTPWGSFGTSWESQYSSLQFIEVGLNLTRIGIDPALYSSVLNSTACVSAFSSIFFKSRSSASFTSNLQDFVGPFDFLQTPVLDYTLSTPALSCTNPTGTINVTNHTTAGYYSWSTSNGNITSTSSNSIQVNKGGSYTLQAAVAQGCPVVKTDVVTVAADTFQPVASMYITSSADFSHYVLHGGNTSASNFSTPFGGSQGLLWNWSGPNGFTSTIQNPQADTVKGTYQLIVTEVRNGCKDTVSEAVIMTVLAQERIVLKAAPSNNNVILTWNTSDHSNIVSFEIEKSTNGNSFTKIGAINNNQPNSNAGFSFTDINAIGLISYRVKMITTSSQTVYSNPVIVDRSEQGIQSYYLAGNYFTRKVHLVINTNTADKATVLVYSTSGQVLYSKNILLQTGQNNIDLPVSDGQNKLQVVSLFINNRLRFTQKAIF